MDIAKHIVAMIIGAILAMLIFFAGLPILYVLLGGGK
ncbi:Uncharacterised protein [Klebsiella pneumoniae]|nr:Uncharacterised protein [Klebsiella pneumoniae]